MISNDSMKIFDNLNINKPLLYKHFYNHINANKNQIAKSIDKQFNILNNIKKQKINCHYTIEKIKFDNKNYNYFLYSHIDNKYINNLTFDQFIKKYHSDFNYQKLINDIYFSYNYNFTYELPNDYINYIKNIKLLNFISLDIKNYIYQKVNNIYCINFNLGKLYIYFNDNDYNIDKITNIINNVILIVNWIYNFKPNDEMIKINIALTPIKRMIDYNDKILTPQNINGGSSQSGKIINIWRYEELYKVLIHELIHYYYLDIRFDYQFENSIKIIMGNNNYPILLNEAITEIQAQYLNCIYILYKLNDKIDIDKFIVLYCFELYFGWVQMMKVCNFYNIKTLDNLLENNDFNQTSNIFSYFILKSLYNINSIDILKNLNHIYLSDYKINCNNDKCYSITKITKQLFNDELKQFFKKNYLNIDKKNISSLRMTLWSLI